MEDIINKYLCSSATEEEKNILLIWLEEKEANRRLFGEMYDLWLYSNASLIDDEKLEKAWHRFKERTSKELTPKELTSEKLTSKELTSTKLTLTDRMKTISLRPLNSYFLRIAASVLLLLVAGYAGYQIRDYQTPAVAINRLLTGADGKGEYTLPDGSTVWLNANSVLEYPESFTGEKRTVKLEGEALFDVKKDTGKPFFVTSGGIEIEVLGTRFLVSNYSGKPVVETMLVNGSVKVGGDYFKNMTHVLQPGELITYNKQTAESNICMVNSADYTNWIHSKLVFDKTNIAQVIINLEKWYGVEIEASPELVKNMHLTFTIRRESLDDILKYMSVTSNITHKWNHNTLYLFPKK